MLLQLQPHILGGHWVGKGGGREKEGGIKRAEDGGRREGALDSERRGRGRGKLLR